MDAFNIPYCGIDLNQAIGDLTLIKTNPFGLSLNTWAKITISGDLCTLYFVYMNSSTSANFSLTVLKNESINFDFYASTNRRIAQIVVYNMEFTINCYTDTGINGAFYEFNFA